MLVEFMFKFKEESLTDYSQLQGKFPGLVCLLRLSCIPFYIP